MRVEWLTRDREEFFWGLYDGDVLVARVIPGRESDARLFAAAGKMRKLLMRHRGDINGSCVECGCVPCAPDCELAAALADAEEPFKEPK